MAQLKVDKLAERKNCANLFHNLAKVNDINKQLRPSFLHQGTSLSTQERANLNKAAVNAGVLLAEKDPTNTSNAKVLIYRIADSNILAYIVCSILLLLLSNVPVDS